MTLPHPAIAEHHAPQFDQAPDAELHTAQQLAMRSIEQTVRSLQPAEEQTPPDDLDLDLAEVMRDSLSRRAAHLPETDAYRVTALMLIRQLTHPTRDTLDRALAFANSLALRDEEQEMAAQSAAAGSPDEDERKQFPYTAPAFFDFTPSAQAVNAAITTYRLARRLHDEATVRQMIAYFNYFNIEIPPAH